MEIFGRRWQDAGGLVDEGAWCGGDEGDPGAWYGGGGGEGGGE